MLDLSPTIVAKSNQLNADDLIGRSLSVTVTDVKLVTGDQPVAIHYEGDNGKPYLPCKSMRRVIIRAWGNDGNQYRGRRMMLFRDEGVTFGGQNVGGIRISHMSHIDKALTLSLTVSRNSRKPYTVQPLPLHAPVEHADDKGVRAEAAKNALLEKLKTVTDAAGIARFQKEHADLLSRLQNAYKDKHQEIMGTIVSMESNFMNAEYSEPTMSQKYDEWLAEGESGSVLASSADSLPPNYLGA